TLSPRVHSRSRGPPGGRAGVRTSPVTATLFPGRIDGIPAGGGAERGTGGGRARDRAPSLHGASRDAAQRLSPAGGGRAGGRGDSRLRTGDQGAGRREHFHG